MGKFKAFLLATILALGTPSSIASLSNQDLAKIPSFSLLENAGFESGSAAWTASGGTYTTTSTAANVGSGITAGSWDSSAASQTLTSRAVVLPSGLKLRNAVVSCNIQSPSGTATHKLQAYDGTNVLAETTITSQTTYSRTSLNFGAPSSGNISARIISVASNEPIIYVDDCYLGPAEGFNVMEVNQAVFYGAVTWVGTSACNWALSSPSGYTSFSADSDCTLPTGANVIGNASDMTGQSKIPSIYFSSLPAGNYKIEASGYFRQNNGSAFVCSYQFYDGTSGNGNLVVGAGSDAIGGPLIARFSHTGGTKTFSIRAATVSGSPSCELFNSSTPTQDLQISVYRFPTSSEIAYRPENPNYDWTSYTPTFTGFGTVTSPECQHKREGSDQLIRCKFTTGTPTATEGRVTLGGGVNTATTTKIPSIQSAGTYFVGSTQTVHGGTVLIAPSLGYVTFSAVGTFGSNSLSALASANGSSIANNTEAVSFTARVPIDGWTSNQNAPLLVGSVTSNSTGMERVERARFNCAGGSSSILSQSGSWISSIATGGGTGLCTATIASSMFTVAPACTCTNEGGTGRICSLNAAPTTTTISFIARNQNGSANEDSSISVVCMGPR